jgi:hypothetical protein
MGTAERAQNCAGMAAQDAEPTEEEMLAEAEHHRLPHSISNGPPLAVKLRVIVA